MAVKRVHVLRVGVVSIAAVALIAAARFDRPRLPPIVAASAGFSPRSVEFPRLSTGELELESRFIPTPIGVRVTWCKSQDACSR